MRCKINSGTAYWSGSLWLRSIIIVLLALILSACTHPITIKPVSTQQQTGSNIYSTKIAAYVMTDADRSIQVISPSTCGEKVSYFPYKDLEKGVRDILKSLYSDVVLVNSPTNYEAIKQDGIAFVYSLNILASSSSDAAFYWPPTQFFIDVTATVTDSDGKVLARLIATGHGVAKVSEFDTDFGLAGRRAAQDALNELATEIQANPKLK
jgi:hypothetical protein